MDPNLVTNSGGHESVEVGQTFEISPNVNSTVYYLYLSDLFSATMAILNPDDFWLLRLALILLGYASGKHSRIYCDFEFAFLVLIPGYFFVQFVKRKWQGLFS